MKIIGPNHIRVWLGVLLATVGMIAVAKELVVPGITAFDAYTLSEKVIVEIQTRPREKLTNAELDIYMNSPSIHFGLGRQDESVVHRIKVTWGILPPEYLTSSVFSDLHDPRVADIEVKGESLVLLIAGGSTASSYRAQLEIAAHGIVRRSVYNVKMGVEQTTTFSYPAFYFENTRAALKRLKEQQLKQSKGQGGTSSKE